MSSTRNAARRAACLAAVALAAAFALPVSAQSSAQKVPPAVAGLLPPEVTLKTGSWGLFPTEFGKSFTADMMAAIPGKPMSCDITVGPELRVSLKGDTAWEAPPMLDMAVQIHEKRVAESRKSLPAHAARLRKTNPAVKSVGAVQEERLPSGQIFSLEYTESCARHQGPSTVVQGYARKGATMLSVDLWISAGAAEAKALVAGVLSRFQQLDTKALAR